ncbi:MAG TPA: ATP-dependent DNA helicase [Acidobacteriota bacterium]|nr:ATP-dependent DNA helicase [Acidobacteriota bacterium]
MESSERSYSISVGSLVERFCRSGDLELEFWQSTHPVEGIRAHQRIQRSRPEQYESEVPVSHQIVRDGISVTVQGRIDGVHQLHDRVIIEEIKTTRRDQSSFQGLENQRHWAQVKLYAHIYSVTYSPPLIETQLTYFHLGSRQTYESRKCFDMGELEDFFNKLIDQFLNQERETRDWCSLRDQTIASLDFPFPRYRSGQRQMAIEVYRAVRDQEHLLVQAPTGIGKTLAAIFPVLKALGEGSTQRILYLAARTTGKAVAQKALKQLRNEGLRLRSVVLTAKDKICFNPEKGCNAEECRFAKGYYDRVGEAIRELLELEFLNRKVIENTARKHTLCPFELSLNLTAAVDCIICDYNYAFDPRAILRNLLYEENFRPTFIVDEAHNLVDRGREMFSAELSKQEILSVRRAIQQRLPTMAKHLSKINSWMLKQRKTFQEEYGSIASPEAPVDLLPVLKQFQQGVEPWISQKANSRFPFRDLLLEFTFKVHRFLRVADGYNECYSTIYERIGKEFRTRLFCIDPAQQLAVALARTSSAIFFSGTLTPADYFRRLFGCGDKAKSLILPSPFPHSNLCVLVGDRVATTFRKRTETKQEVALALISLITSRKGNYLLFFPSYKYLNMVLEVFHSTAPEVITLIQSPEMTETDREMFLEEFTEQQEDTVVGFAVMGGAFGEAIDLTGERLAGAAVVGVGLPAICAERELIRSFFDTREGKGFDYAYSYPGIIRVLQAAGRVIRSETDRGVVFLIDERFARRPYRHLLPAEWCPAPVRNSAQIEDSLTRFWTVPTPSIKGQE